MTHTPNRYTPNYPVRVVTATSLFDGHDASINVMRRLIQDTGCEVIHLGHNRSVAEIVGAAIQEDAHAIAVTSYQGGHVEFFQYMVDMLRDRKAPNIRVFGGGGGTILPREAEALHGYGVARIYSPEDGRTLGLQGMINDLVAKADYDVTGTGMGVDALAGIIRDTPVFNDNLLARLMTLAELGGLTPALTAALEARRDSLKAEAKISPVFGITGTGGSGKSSLTDELLLRFVTDFPESRVCVLAVDPSRKRSGGALLGDRIRMNTASHPQVFMRSFATRQSGDELSPAIRSAIDVARAAGFDLIILETSGIGQADTAVTGVADVSLYVMTPEYGAASQLEKIDMLDFADLVAINKFDRRGAEDAYRDVCRQVRRTKLAFDKPDEALAVFGTIASRFNDDGVDALYLEALTALAAKGGGPFASRLDKPSARISTRREPFIPSARVGYLGDIARAVRGHREWVEKQARLAREVWHLDAVVAPLRTDPSCAAGEVEERLTALRDRAQAQLDPTARAALDNWPKLVAQYAGDEFIYRVRGQEIRQPLVTTTLSGNRIPRVILPKTDDPAEILRYVFLEGAPGSFPYTAGVYPLKRTDEDPKRMFAGEGGPERTNQRFHYLCDDEPAKRLSTAFDSVTLYGENPDPRPDIFGKVGESGVSVCTLEDARRLYAGFDLCAKNTSVSMTINGPAPIVLAFFLNTAIDQQADRFEREHRRKPTPDEFAALKAETLKQVRGTVQADILKEDQAQNTCIFSTEFALKMMGDIQAFFVESEVRNFYGVSISGYHIAEAGANPISQTAFTLANGFTFVEYYLARGMAIDDFAPNLSFFFSNGLDIEYAVIGRVARRIWAIAMRDLYKAAPRSQMLKYHIQTSGRSLHAQEVDFNDIRTTLQALMALYDNCNSLHTNAYDEAVTTPTEESVRRAMAIQLIINREFGLMRNENGLQGSYLVGELTDLVEEAILREFERLNDRGGVLGAMERMYQRGKIQDESMLYERQKHSGELPVIGVNTFINPHAQVNDAVDKMSVTRASHDEKSARHQALRDYQAEAGHDARRQALERLKSVARGGGNIFAELMDTARLCSLGEMTHALYEVGGRYRRSM
jgi:isobutyryl-CoA mutase